jgi:hypothetical protein
VTTPQNIKIIFKGIIYFSLPNKYTYVKYNLVLNHLETALLSVPQSKDEEEDKQYRQNNSDDNSSTSSGWQLKNL